MSNEFSELMRNRLEPISVDPSNLENYMDTISILQKRLYTEDNPKEFFKHYISWKILEDIIYNTTEDDLFPDENFKNLISSSTSKIIEMYTNDITIPSQLEDIFFSIKNNIIEAQGSKGNNISLFDDKLGYRVRLSQKDSKRRVSIGACKYMPDMDLTLFDPKISKSLVNKILEIIINNLSDIDSYCFIEKRKGPIGALSIASYIVNETEKPVFVYRPRHMNEQCKFDGIPPKKGQKVCIIYDLARSGSGLIEAAWEIEKEYPVNVDSAIVFFDLNEGAIDKLGKMGIKLYSAILKKSEKMDEDINKKKNELSIDINKLIKDESSPEDDLIDKIDDYINLNIISD